MARLRVPVIRPHLHLAGGHPTGGRVGLGCMRLSTDADRDEARALATIHAALEAGVRVLDTAHAYGLDDSELGHNERLLARAGLPSDVLVVTKGGMRRPRGSWQPDGRARTIRSDAEASAEALGRPADLWLLHAPDPRVDLRTSLRAIAKIVDDGTARAVGLSNVTRTQLAFALEVLEVSAVEVALGPLDEGALLSGLVELCTARGISVLAYAPFGGPARAARIAKDPHLAAIARTRGVSAHDVSAHDVSAHDVSAHDVSAHDVALAWLLSLSEVVVPLPGARRPETAARCRAEPLGEPERAALAPRFPAAALARARVPPAYVEGEVVLVMGLPGAGKTQAVGEWTSQGYLRFNRDERGGTLAGVRAALDAALVRGARRAVLDNTYLTRIARAEVLLVAWRHRLPVRCVFVDTPADVAAVRLAGRLLTQLGALPEPADLARSELAGVLGPTRHQRMARELEPPAEDEGFAHVEVRRPAPASPLEIAARIVTLDGDARPGYPTLRLGWMPDVEREALLALRAHEARHVELAVCVHGGGAPSCWCRPPLPGLVVQWTRARGLDPRALAFVGGGATFRRMAAAFSARWEEAPPAADR